MITIFNRQELITIASQQKFFSIREALANAGIESYTKTHGILGAAANRSRGMPGRKREYVSKVGDTYRISNMLGWTKITKNGAITVWQNDVLSYAVKLFLTVSVVNIFCLAGWAAVVVNKGKR